MKRAISTYGKDFIAIILIALLSLAVATVILSNERLTLPGWVPLVGKSFYMLKGEFRRPRRSRRARARRSNIAGVPGRARSPRSSSRTAGPSSR